MQLTVCSFNIRTEALGDGKNFFYNRENRILSLITERKPDLIGFQEVTESGRAFFDDALTDYTVLGCGRLAGYRGEGVSLAYRKDLFRLLHYENFWLSPTPDVPESTFGLDQSGCPRVCQIAVLVPRAGGEPIAFANTHLDHQGKTAQTLGAEQILQKLNELGYPFLVTGDFNAAPDSDAVRVFTECKKPKITDATANLAGTFHDFGRRKEDTKIDYVLTTGKVLSPARIERDEPEDGVYLSDHYPVFAEIDLGVGRRSARMADQFRWLEDGAAQYEGTADALVDYTFRHQLLKTDLWKKFVEVFRTGADIGNDGWRGEYFGKMMRGACLCYRYRPDEELYTVLTDAVRDLLSTQDELGRISSYTVEHEFFGWDVWSRKYVMTGLQHYYDICRDEELKAEILAALCRHADYITEKLGPHGDQQNILLTTTFWGGVNSASILEPFMRLYEMTNERRYLRFAGYILSTGGCKDGNLILLAMRNEIPPYEYPEVKAYETMSFFEGLLAYACVTGDEGYRRAALNFAERVEETDITVIGCAGCTHELFDHSAVKQTEWSEIIMQETCVTVTWMRLCARLLHLTGDAKYADRIEISAYNALAGTPNFEKNRAWNPYKKVGSEGLAFDSYSPLYNNIRGLGCGGKQTLADGSFYGCCACIAAAGVGLFPLEAVLQADDGAVINFFLPGRAAVTTPEGQTMVVSIETEYPKTGDVKLTLSLPRPETLSLRVRIPAFCGMEQVLMGDVTVPVKDGYAVLTEEFCEGDEIVFRLPMALRRMELNGKTAFFRGPLVLARDAAKEAPKPDLAADVSLLWKDGEPTAAEEQPEGRETVRLRLATADGGSILLSDYASCGLRWGGAPITVWMNVK